MVKINLDEKSQYELSSWQYIGRYRGRYYGPKVENLGWIPVSIACVTWVDSDREAWLVAETPYGGNVSHGVYETREEAVAVAKALIAKRDEGGDK